MENTIKGFVLLKNPNKKEDKHPDYKINIKIGENWVDAGAAWIKDGKKGKYLSAKLNDAKDTRAGFRIEVENPPLKEVNNDVGVGL